MEAFREVDIIVIGWMLAGKALMMRGLRFASQSQEECVVTFASCLLASLPAWLAETAARL